MEKNRKNIVTLIYTLSILSYGLTYSMNQETGPLSKADLSPEEIEQLSRAYIGSPNLPRQKSQSIDKLELSPEERQKIEEELSVNPMKGSSKDRQDTSRYMHYSPEEARELQEIEELSKAHIQLSPQQQKELLLKRMQTGTHVGQTASQLKQ
ncbi:hypothetical protein H0X48_06155 [Candidatus Dependentiae bacterium]|nr:hypothetical protein [Candidatus Dependentiae bacterium]